MKQNASTLLGAPSANPNCGQRKTANRVLVFTTLQPRMLHEEPIAENNSVDLSLADKVPVDYGKQSDCLLIGRTQQGHISRLTRSGEVGTGTPESGPLATYNCDTSPARRCAST